MNARASVSGSTSRVPELDGLRGIAISLILLYHFAVFSSPSENLRNVLQFGWVGVDLFFALSGYLITGILLDSRHRSDYFGSFYYRRIFRIFPVYYTFLIVFFHLGPLLAHLPRLGFLGRAPGEEWWYWVYISNWCPEDRRAGVLTHIWSLCIEEQFYLFWPLVVRLIAPARLRSVCIAILVASPLARAAGVALHVSPELIYECTVFRLDALAAGALIAIAARDPDTKRSLERFLVPCVGVSLAVLTAVLWTSGASNRIAPMQIFGLTPIAVLSAGIVFRATRSALILRLPALRNMGKYSYAIYVWHPLLVIRARAIFLGLQPGSTPFFKWLLFAVLVALGSFASYAVGWISWRLIERPAAWWRDRLDRKLRPAWETAAGD